MIRSINAEQYTKGTLSESKVAKTPSEQFHEWFDQARAEKITMPEALTLSTAELPSGKISARVVLMKELNKDGDVVIYSNWESSRKSADFRTNQHVALTWWWKELERQVRVEGVAHRLTTEESQAYFDSRPRGSRIGAWASHQSQHVESREALDAEVAKFEAKFAGQEKIPCPPFWGGIVVVPDHWEFFQGRNNRVHDRITYDRTPDGWKIGRLYP